MEIRYLCRTVAEFTISSVPSLNFAVRESGHGFATYINDVMARCKVQKAILHCLSASVYNTKNPRSHTGEDPLQPQSITESVIYFNEELLDTHVVEAFQVYTICI